MKITITIESNEDSTTKEFAASSLLLTISKILLTNLEEAKSLFRSFHAIYEIARHEQEAEKAAHEKKAKEAFFYLKRRFGNEKDRSEVCTQ